MLDHSKYRHTESFTFPFGTGIRKRETSCIIRYSSERHYFVKFIRFFLVKNGRCFFVCYLAKLCVHKLIKDCSTVVCVCMCILNPSPWNLSVVQEKKSKYGKPFVSS